MGTPYHVCRLEHEKYNFKINDTELSPNFFESGALFF